MKRSLCCLLTMTLVLNGAQLFAQETKTAATNAKPSRLSRAALEKKFSELLTGSALVGTFSVDAAGDTKPPEPERYEIVSVSKLPDAKDMWVIVARFRYADKKLSPPLPIALKVLWAGDTPVMSLTNLTIPGMGTFTARVMFYGDRYAGTWQHGSVGGHMWGKIESAKKSEKESGSKTDAKPQ